MSWAQGRWWDLFTPCPAGLIPRKPKLSGWMAAPLPRPPPLHHHQHLNHRRRQHRLSSAACGIPHHGLQAPRAPASLATAFALAHHVFELPRKCWSLGMLRDRHVWQGRLNSDKKSGSMFMPPGPEESFSSGSLRGKTGEGEQCFAACLKISETVCLLLLRLHMSELRIATLRAVTLDGTCADKERAELLFKPVHEKLRRCSEKRLAGFALFEITDKAPVERCSSRLRGRASSPRLVNTKSTWQTCAYHLGPPATLSCHR